MASNRGPYFSVLRHSVRADVFEKNEEDEELWRDRLDRPWDPPIVDYELPRKVVHSADSYLSATNVMAIYSSPFRRCLQTAAAVAQSLNIGQVLVHPGLGEVMAHVRKCCLEGSTTEATIENYLLTEEECAKTVELASGGKVEMKRPFVDDAIVPPWNETYAQSATRLESVLKELQSHHLSSQQCVVVVTHGDALQAAAQVFLGSSTSVYDLDFCALMIHDADQKLCYHHGLKIMELG